MIPNPDPPVITLEDRKLLGLTLNLLHPSSDNARKTYSQKALEELIESLRNLKQQVPLIVYPHPTIAGHYEIADGFRRWLALQRLEAQTAMCLILAAKPDKLALLAIMLSLGVTNEKLSIGDLVDGVNTLIREQGKTQEQVAEQIGCSQSKISKARSIAEYLAPQLRPDADNGLIPFTVASDLARLKGNHEAQIDIANRVKQKLLRRDDVNAAVNRALGGPKAKAKPVRARTSKGVQMVLPVMDVEALIAELTAVIEAIRKAVKHGLPLNSLQQLLKGA